MTNAASNIQLLHPVSEAKVDSVISSGAEFEGNIIANKGVRIEGKLKGNVTIKNQEGGIVIVAAGGYLTGNITAPLVVVEEGGTVKGNIESAKAVDIQGALEGDLVYGGKISVGDNAEICGAFMSSKRKPSA